MKTKMRSKTKWNDVSPKVRTKGREAIFDALEHILDEANKIVPHDEGILQASGQIFINSVHMSGNVSYNTPYAIRLHEHPEYNFQKGRQGKWLERTIKARKKAVLGYMKNKMQEAFD